MAAAATTTFHKLKREGIMSEKISALARSQQADAAVADWDGATLEIRTGAQPATADTAASGTLLVSMTLPTPAFGAASSGVASKSGTWNGTAGNTGTAGWFRVIGAVGVYDGAVTATGGGGDMELDSTSITSGQLVTINTFTLTQPAS